MASSSSIKHPTSSGKSRSTEKHKTLGSVAAVADGGSSMDFIRPNLEETARPTALIEVQDIANAVALCLMEVTVRFVRNHVDFAFCSNLVDVWAVICMQRYTFVSYACSEMHAVIYARILHESCYACSNMHVCGSPARVSSMERLLLLQESSRDFHRPLHRWRWWKFLLRSRNMMMGVRCHHPHHQAYRTFLF